MVTSQECKIKYTTCIDGVNAVYNYVGTLSRSQSLLRIEFLENIDGEVSKTAFSILKSGAVKLCKKGALSYEVTLAVSSVVDLLLELQGFSIPLKVKTLKISQNQTKNSIYLFIEYIIINGDLETNSKVTLHVFF